MFRTGFLSIIRSIVLYTQQQVCHTGYADCQQAEIRASRWFYYKNLPLTSVLNGGGWSTSRPGHFTPGKDPVPIVTLFKVHCAPQGWSGRVRKISLLPDSIPGPSSTYRVAIPTTLYQPAQCRVLHMNFREKLKKTMKILGQKCRSLGLYFYLGPLNTSRDV